MAVVKYGEGVTPLIKSEAGFSFKSGAFGNSITKKNRGTHAQSKWQQIMSTFLMNACRHWRTLTTEQKQNWLDWAEQFPQPQIRDHSKNLPAYQNFTKRNFYKMISEGPAFVFMTNPNLVLYPSEAVTIQVLVTSSEISLKLVFVENDNNQECIIFISPTQSKGKSWVTDATRLMYVVSNVNQTIDITEMFISKFARVPIPGENLFTSAIFCGKDNGQFSFEQKSVNPSEPAAPDFNFSVKYYGNILGSPEGTTETGGTIDVYSYSPPYTIPYKIDFGDGTILENQTEPVPAHIYTDGLSSHTIRITYSQPELIESVGLYLFNSTMTDNGFDEIDISQLPNVSYLELEIDKMTALDISHNPNINYLVLYVWYDRYLINGLSPLASLSIPPVNVISTFNFAETSATTIDLSNMIIENGATFGFFMDENPNLTEITGFQVTTVTPNINFYFTNCALSESTVDAILIELDSKSTSGNKTIYINGGTTATPSAAGIAAANSLISKGWKVYTN